MDFSFAASEVQTVQNCYDQCHKRLKKDTHHSCCSYIKGIVSDQPLSACVLNQVEGTDIPPTVSPIAVADGDTTVFAGWVFPKGSDVGEDGTEPVPDTKLEIDAAFELTAGLSSAIAAMNLIY